MGTERNVIEMLSAGRISIGKAAELLKVSIYDIYKIAEKRGIKLGGTSEQGLKSRESAKRYL